MNSHLHTDYYGYIYAVMQSMAIGGNYHQRPNLLFVLISMEIKMKGLAIPRKLKIALITIAVLIALYAILGFFVLPAVLTDQIPKLAKEHINRNVQTREIKFNPFSLEFTLKGLQIDEHDGSEFVTFEAFYTNIAVVDSLLDLSLKIDEVLLKSPYVSVKRDNKADFNFADLISKEEKKENEEEPENDEIFAVTIAKIAISEGKISWTDDLHSKAHQEDIQPLNLTVNNFTTIIDKQSQLGFSLVFASGGQFDWKGELTLNPLQSSGHIELNNVNFHRVWELFLQPSVNFTIVKGSEVIKADYQLDASGEEMQLLINNADISLLDIQLAEKAVKDTLIDIPDFKVSGISLDLLKQNIEIDKVSSKNAKFKAWLNADGTINYQSLFAPVNAGVQKPAPEPDSVADNSKPWNVLVKQLDISNYAFNFTDRTLSPPNPIAITSINLSSSQLSTKPGASLPFDLALLLNKSGTLKVKGDAVLEPLASNIQLDIGSIVLKDFQPYVSQFARLDILSGLFNVNAKVSLKQPKGLPLAVTFKGNSSIDKLHTRDQISNKDFINWKKLSVDKIDLDLAANRYDIGAIKIDRPYARILIRKDKSINITDIVINKDNKEVAEKQPADDKKADKPNFKISRFSMSKGVMDFTDKSLFLPFAAHIKHLKGSVKGVSSKKNATIKIALDGRVADFAPVTIKGKITPDRGDSNFKVDFDSMPLPLMTPYMAEFAGRKIEKGNMTLIFEYKIHNKELTASNNLLIDQLVLGDEVDNPDAVSLPLGLAIALLQDGDGKIKLDVPVTGDLDNPEFSVGAIIVDALVNVLTKIVASPFNAIASLIGGDEDISKVAFAAGDAELDEKQLKKLDGLATALSERPALKLEIKGAAYSKQDWPQMQVAALDKQILLLRADELTKDGDKEAIPKQLAHSDKEYQRLLADLFIKKFPDLADRSLFGTPRLINSETEDFYQVAQNKLAAMIPPDNQGLHKLAASRAKAIAKHLVDKKIEIKRVFLLDVAIDPENENDLITSSLNLTTD